MSEEITFQIFLSRLENYKHQIEKEDDNYVDEIYAAFLKITADIRNGEVTDEHLVKIFINDELPKIVELILTRCYRYWSGIKPQAKYHQIILLAIDLAMYSFEKEYCNIQSILGLIGNILSESVYFYNCYHSHKEIIERMEALNPLSLDHLPEYRTWYQERTMYKQRDDINTWLEERTSKKQSNGWRSPLEGSEDEQKDPTEENTKENTRPVYKSVTKPSFVGLSRYSPYLFVHINYFAHVGGFKMLTDLVENSRNFAIIASALEIMKELYYYLEEEYAEKEIIERIKEPLKALPKLLSDDGIKKSAKEDINKLLRLIEQTLSPKCSNFEAKKIVGEFELEVILVCLKSQYIEKRIFGITSLISKIDDARSNDYNESYRAQYHSKSEYKPTHWLTTAALLNWISENNILSIVFGETSHTELIRRSSPLLRFLFTQKRITLQDAEMITHLAFSKHDAFRTFVFKALADVADAMSVEELEFLFKKLKIMGSNEVDADVLHLLKRFLDSLRFHNPSAFRRRPKFLAPIYPKKNTTVISKSQLQKKQTSEEEKYDGEKVELKSKLLMNDSGNLVDTNLLEEEKIDKSEPIHTYTDDLESEKPFCYKEHYNNNNAANPNEDAKGYGQESILNLKENDSQYPQIITHHVPSKNESLLTENQKSPEEIEEKNNEERDSQAESSPEKKQQKEDSPKEGENPEAKLGAEILDYIWQFIQSSYYLKNITAQLIQSATQTFKETLGFRYRGLRIEYIEKCIKSIRKNVAVNECIEIIQYIMKGPYPIALKDGNELDRKTTLIKYMEDEYQILTQIFQSMLLLKTELVDLMLEGNNSSPEANGPQQEERHSHGENNHEPGERMEIINEDQAQRPNTSQQLAIDEESKDFDPNNNTKETQSTDYSDDSASHKNNVRAGSQNLKNILLKKFGDSNENNLITHYTKECDSRLQFVRNLLSDNFQAFELRQVKLLWELFVVNSFWEQERDIFFKYFYSIIFCSDTECNILNEETINYLFFDILLKLDFRNYSQSIFHCFEAFFLYLNKKYQTIKSEHLDGYTVQTFELIGLEFLWELFIQSPDSKVNSSCTNLLIRLIRNSQVKSSNNLLGDDTELSSLHIAQNFFIDLAARNIDQSYKRIEQQQQFGNQEIDIGEEDQNRISRSIDFILRLIEEFEGVSKKSQNNNNPADQLVLTINNNIAGALPPKRFSVNAYKNMTVGELRKLIASKTNPPIPVDELAMFTRGSILNDDKLTLAEKKFATSQTVICSQQKRDDFFDTTDVQGVSGMIGPLKEISERELNEKVNDLLGIFPHLQPPLLKFALQKKSYDYENTVIALLEESNVTLYSQEMENAEIEERKKKTNVGGKGLITSRSLSATIANKSEYFELLLKLLKIPKTEIQSKVWALLSNLPLNATLYEKFNNFIPAIIEADFNWKELIDSENSARVLYSLQIINTFITCGMLDEKEQETEIKERAKWRQDFVEYQGFAHIYSLFISSNTDDVVKTTERLNNSRNVNLFNTEARSLSMLLSFVKTFSNAALLALSPEHIRTQLAYCLNIKRLDNDNSKPNASDANETGAQIEQPNLNNNDAAPAPAGDGEAQKVGNDPSQGLIDEMVVLTNVMRNTHKSLAQEILHTIDIETLLKKVLEIISSCYLYSEKDQDISNLIENCFMFMLPCLVARPHLFSVLYEFHPISELISRILIACPIDSIRVALNRIIMFLSKSYHEPNTNYNADEAGLDQVYHEEGNIEDNQFVFPEDPKQYFLNLLFPSLYNDFDKNSYEDYFWTLASLLKMVSASNTSSNSVNFEELYIMVIRTIKERPIFEDRVSEAPDRALAGFMHLAQSLLEIDPALKCIFTDIRPGIQALLQKNGLLNFKLIEELHNYLFYIPSDDFHSIQSSLSLPKCKKKLTRKKTFALLVALCSDCDENFFTLLPLLACNHTQLYSNDLSGGLQANYLNVDTRNFTGFVGLKNLGCTCYINSLLQQFYMIKPLRNAILNAEIHLKNDSQQPVSPHALPKAQIQADASLRTKLEDNVLYHLQLVFANLKESLHQYHIPDHFCRAVKDTNGQAINVCIQQDVDEFFNTLCDKLDNHLKSEECKSIVQENAPEIVSQKAEADSKTQQISSLNELIGGVLSHEIISLEPEFPYYGEREEAYLTIALEIKNKKSIAEALDMYVRGDILEGDNKYYCEKYDKKIKVMKRCCVKSLPNTVIVTLKRFEFDLNLMQKVKLNDYFEFPMSINLKPWTKAGLREKENYGGENSVLGSLQAEEDYDDSYYEFLLTGVLVHSGTAEGGHYYSFIKDREDLNQNWYEFNDNIVKPFDLINLKAECFGGEVDNADSYKDFGLYEWDYNKSRNAYILFYERTKPQKNEKYEYAIQKGMPQVLVERIWKENLEFLKSKFFFDHDYFEFIRNFVTLYQFSYITDVTSVISENPEIRKLKLWTTENERLIAEAKSNPANLVALVEKAKELNSSGHQKAESTTRNGREQSQITQEIKTLEDYEQTSEIKILRLSFVFAYEILTQVRDVNTFVACMQTIKPVFERYIPASFWLLNFLLENKSIIHQIYIENSSSEPKYIFSKILTAALKMVYNFEKFYILEEETFELVEFVDSQAELEPKLAEKKVPRSSLIRFLHHFCLDFFDVCKKNLTKHAEYLQLVKSICQLGPETAAYLVKAGMLSQYIDIYVATQPSTGMLSPFGSQKEAEKFAESNMVFIVEIFTQLLLGCETVGERNIKQRSLVSYFQEPPQILLPESVEKSFLDAYNYLKVFLKLQQYNDCLLDISVHLCWGNLSNSRSIISFVSSALSYSLTSWERVDQIFKILSAIIRLEDIYQKQRIEIMFEKDLNKGNRGIMFSRAEDLIGSIRKGLGSYESNYVLVCLKWIAELGVGCSPFKEYMRGHVEEFKWMLDTLVTFSKNNSNHFGIFSTTFDHNFSQTARTVLAQMRDIFGLNTDSSEDEAQKKPEMECEDSKAEKDNENQKEEEPPIGRKQGKAADSKYSEAFSGNADWKNLGESINKLDEPEKEFDVVEPTTFTTWEEKNDPPFSDDVSKKYSKNDKL